MLALGIYVGFWPTKQDFPRRIGGVDIKVLWNTRLQCLAFVYADFLLPRVGLPLND